MSAVLSMALAALLSVLGRLATSVFFEAVFERVIVWGLKQLAPKTTNTLDDEIVAEIEKRLQTPHMGP